MEPTETLVGLPSPAVAPLVERLVPGPARSGPEPLSAFVVLPGGGAPIGPDEGNALISELFRYSSHGRGRRFTAEERTRITAALNESLTALGTLRLTDREAVGGGHRALRDRLLREGSIGRGLSAKGKHVWQELLSTFCVHVLHRLAHRAPESPAPADHRARSNAELIRRSDERLLAQRRRLEESDRDFERDYLARIREEHRTVRVLGLAEEGVSDASATRPADRVGVTVRAVTPRGASRDAGLLPGEHPRLLVRGGPGSGKTFLAARLAIGATREDAPPWLRGRIPFPVPLRSHTASDAPPGTVDELIASRPGFPLQRLHDGWIDRVLSEGRGLVLLDGLDEAAYAYRTAVGKLIGELVTVHPGNLCVVLTRPHAARDGWLARSGFTEATLLPLTDDERTALVHRWNPGAPGGPDDPGSPEGPDSSDTGAAALEGLLRSRPPLAEAAATPLICATLSALTAEHGVLPAPAYLHGVTALLLGARDRARRIGAERALPLLDEDRYAALQAVAHRMALDGRPELPSRTVLQLFEESVPGVGTGRRAVAARALLAYLTERAGLLTARPADSVAFTHTAVRDFLLVRRTLTTGDRPVVAAPAGVPEWIAAAREDGYEDGYGGGHAAGAVPPLPLEPVAADDEPPTLVVPDPALVPPAETTQAEPPQALPSLGAIPPPPVPPATGPARPRTPAAGPGAAPRTASDSGVRGLAAALSVATRIEPELLRAVRVRLFPRLDVGDESDLWFGPWTAARTQGAIALRPGLLPELRAELAERLRHSPPDDPLWNLGELVSRTHAALSPALRLEERAVWADVCVRAGRAEALEEVLRPALRALVAEGRDGIADWLAGAWPRLPDAVRGTVTAWQLATVTAHRIPGHGPAVPEPPPALAPADVAVLADAVPQVPLTVARVGRRLRLGGPVNGGDAILVPDTDPRMVEILPLPDGPARTVLVASCATTTVRIGAGGARLRTPLGAVYELRGDRTTDSAPPEARKLPERATAAELLALLDSDISLSAPLAALEGLRGLLELLCEAGLPEVGVLPEYRLPGSSRRVDALVTGFGPEGESVFLVVEIKGGQRVAPQAIRTALSRVRRDRDHLVRSRLHFAASPQRMGALVYWGRTETRSLTAYPPTDIPILGEFARNEAVELLQRRFSERPGLPAAEDLLDGPGWAFYSVHPQFTVAPGWEEGYERVLAEVVRAGSAEVKEVIVVTGGPAGGGTAVGLAVLRELTRRGVSAVYTSASAALNGAVRAAWACGPPELDNIRNLDFLRGPGEGRPFSLICDGAQYIRMFPRRRSQIEKLIKTARVPVFLLDERGGGHPGETGTFAAIARAASQAGCTVREIDLDALAQPQRAPYDRWVSVLLGLEPDGSVPGGGPPPNPEVRLADTPGELEELVSARIRRGRTARLLAGCCWTDPPEHGSGSGIRLGGWWRPWVSRSYASHDVPGADTWMVHPQGFASIGTPHLARGTLFDWCGVIIGPDLVWRDGDWVTDRRASRDLRIRDASDEDADRYIRAAYRTLLTRGLHGVVVHSTDPETRAMLRGLLPGGSGPG
ncbi:DNA/RNA helicase domain-containing protein [Streptomyces sp. NPDC000594]|uniref:DNA/RNA helicase domain-containing protein n=1 Tax=Streptomyces sp. NPDC000594 TaxID=3154261 RepID=UPI00332C131D